MHDPILPPDSGPSQPPRPGIPGGPDPAADDPWLRVGDALQDLRGPLVCDGASVWLPFTSAPNAALVPAEGWGVGFDAPARLSALATLCRTLVAGPPGRDGDRIADLQTAPPELRQLLEGCGLGSILLRPLVARGASFGWISIQSRHPGFFTSSRMQTLSRTLATVTVEALAGVLINAESFRSFLVEIAGGVGHAESFTDGCRFAVETLARSQGVRGTAIVTRGPEGNCNLRGLAGEAAPGVVIGNPLDLSGVDGGLDALRTGVRSVPFLESALFRAAETDETTLISVPLAVGSRFQGVLLLRLDVTSRSPRVPDPESLQTLGREIALSLETLRVIEDRDHSLRTSRQLLNLSHEVSSVLDLRHVPRLVAEYASAVCEADECVLFLLDGDGQTLFPVVYLGAFEEQVMQVRPRLGEGITGWVGKTRRGEIANHAETDPRAGYIPGTPVEPEAILAVPMVVADELIGVLTLYKLEGRTFRAPDLDAVNIFSTQAAIALVNARLFSSVQQERGRLVTMLEHMKEGVIFGDKDGRVLLMNAAAGRMLELESGAGVHASILDLLSGADFDAIRNELIEVREGRSGHLHGEHQIRRRNYLVSISSVPGGEPGEVLGEVLLLQDITQHKQIEAQLLESNKMSAVGQLAAGVAHEFNNLITGIYGYAQLIQMNPASDAARRGVDVILKSSERAQGLTNSLLTFSRRRPGRREPVQVDSLLGDTLLLLARQFEKAGIRVTRETDGLPPVVADGGELQQAFLNLLINALQALPEGGEVRVSGRALPDGVEVTVADNGPGIPAANLPRVFDPFFTTKGPLGGTNVPGSGLGLTTAYNILRDHGGGVEVESVEGEGARFIVRIPLQPADSPSVDPPVQAARPRDASVVILGQDMAEGDEIAEVLTGLGYQAHPETRVKLVLEFMRHNPLDLIILNGPMQIEDSSPYGLIRAADSRVPILFLPERTPGADFPGLSDRWAFLLRKPYRNRDLASMASRLITRRLPAAS